MLKNSLTPEYIQGIMKKSHVEVTKVFDKCTVVSMKLPNGFIIVEASACADPKNYDEELGKEICLKKIEDKIWLMEGYQLNTHLHLSRRERMKGSSI